MSTTYAVMLLTATGLFAVHIEADNRLAAMTRAKQLYRPCLALWAKEVS
jgi:hypothetical protein